MSKNPYTPATQVSKIDLLAQEIRAQGFLSFIASHLRKRLKDPLSYWFAKKYFSSQTFFYDNDRYHYFVHRYNFTWTNERAVEIPIFQSVARKYAKKRILEIGNVLSHYQPTDHDIVDKYEIKEGIINEDVTCFKSKKKFDLIISISTLEHVGWHEEPYVKDKILYALIHLQTLLKPAGEIIFSVPLGMNLDLDRLLRKNKLPIHQKIFLKRRDTKNHWSEASWEEVRNSHYNTPFPNANAIMIARVTR